MVNSTLPRSWTFKSLTHRINGLVDYSAGYSKSDFISSLTFTMEFYGFFGSRQMVKGVIIKCTRDLGGCIAYPGIEPDSVVEDNDDEPGSDSHDGESVVVS